MVFLAFLGKTLQSTGFYVDLGDVENAGHVFACNAL
jgi:hypothetical protein